MKKIHIRTQEDFQWWARVQMAIQNTNARKLAEQMGISYPRISEALHGKPRGRKHIKPLIERLGGNVDDFKAIM